jgi:quercetin dioxygenase-like cupin family protein
MIGIRFSKEATMHRIKLVIVFLATSSALVVAQNMPMPINASDIKWESAPNVLPPGVRMAVVSGDPSKDALYVVRLKMPANYEIPAHNHPTTEHVTVLSGEFNVGMGDKLDRKKGLALQAGGFVEATAKMNHYAWTSSETVVQIHGQGPFAITYVNPTRARNSRFKNPY